MTGPDYPMLTIPGYDLYQAALVVSFVVDALARHRHAAGQADHVGRRTAARDVHAGRLALSRIAGDPDLARGPGYLPENADVTAAVASLDPANEQHRVVATALRGISDELDRTITRRFPPRPAPPSSAAPRARKDTPVAGFPAAAQALAASTPATATARRASSPPVEPTIGRPAPSPRPKPSRQPGR